MSIYNDFKKELLEKGKENVLSKKIKIAKEHAIFKDLIAKSPKCRKCGRAERLTLDHIIPEKILRDFGIDTAVEMLENNYQILCQFCNRFKSDRLDFSIPETKEILLELLNNIYP